MQPSESKIRGQDPERSRRLSQVLPGFVEYMIAERRLAAKTVRGYREAIQFFIKRVGDVPLQHLTLADFVSFKAEMLRRGAGESRIAGIINGMKGLLLYGRDILEYAIALDITKLKAPKPPRREVVYLTPEEVETFFNAIPLRAWNTRPRFSGF